MKTNERIFSHPSQLNGLSTLSFFRTRGLGELRLGGSVEGHSDRERWEGELNQHYYACGCDTSAKSLIIGLLGGSVWAGYSYFEDIWGVGVAVGAAVSVAIGGAIVGKIFGLFQANKRLKQTIEEIKVQWEVEEKPEREQWACG
ncbi:MAG: hypothetical protein GY719_41720 [bacterium]|nr:hypothetical protein [bacterium]